MLNDLVITRPFVPELGCVHEVKNRFLATVHQQVGPGNQQRTGGTEVLVIGLQHGVVIGREIVKEGESSAGSTYFQNAIAKIRSAVPITVARGVVKIATGINHRGAPRHPDTASL